MKVLLGGEGGCLRGVGLSLGPMNGAWRMLRRCVDGVQAKVDVAAIHNVVACPSGNVDESVASHPALFALFIAIALFAASVLLGLLFTSAVFGYPVGGIA